MKEKEISKFISLILRHKPDVIGITLDEHGWAKVDELIEGISKTTNNKLGTRGDDNGSSADFKKIFSAPGSE